MCPTTATLRMSNWTCYHPFRLTIAPNFISGTPRSHDRVAGFSRLETLWHFATYNCISSDGGIFGFIFVFSPSKAEILEIKEDGTFLGLCAVVKGVFEGRNLRQLTKIRVDTPWNERVWRRSMRNGIYDRSLSLLLGLHNSFITYEVYTIDGHKSLCKAHDPMIIFCFSYGGFHVEPLEYND